MAASGPGGELCQLLQECPQEFGLLVGREEMLQEVFLLLGGVAGTLKQSRLRLFAKKCGFEGGDEQWAEDWEEMCIMLGADPASGVIQFDHFVELVNDEDGACYRDDNDLADLILGLSKNPHPKGHSSGPSSGPPSQRTSQRTHSQRTGEGSSLSHRESSFDGRLDEDSEAVRSLAPIRSRIGTGIEPSIHEEPVDAEPSTGDSSPSRSPRRQEDWSPRSAPEPCAAEGDCRAGRTGRHSTCTFITIRRENGAEYSGEVNGEGQAHGLGSQTWRRREGEDKADEYMGEWVEDIMHGKGAFAHASGSYYEGSWAHGRQNGHGSLRFRNGELYEGDWEDGEMTGRGLFRWHDGAFYKGDFVEGLRHGSGTMRWTNEYKEYTAEYKGQWKNDERHGFGYQKPPGAEGEWKHGAFVRWLEPHTLKRVTPGAPDRTSAGSASATLLASSAGRCTSAAERCVVS